VSDSDLTGSKAETAESTEPSSPEEKMALPVQRRTSALSFKPFRIYFGGTVLAMNALRLGAVAQGLLMWELT